MKKPYLEPELEVICFMTEAVMSISSFPEDTDDRHVNGEVELPAV